LSSIFIAKDLVISLRTFLNNHATAIKKNDSYIIKECPIWPPKKSITIYTTLVGSYNAGGSMDTTPITQNAPSLVQLVTPKMI
jgi:hypothetical protein